MQVLGIKKDKLNMYFDMILVHAPSVYDFRHCDDVLFAYLSNSDSVHVSPIFEMPPVGILAIKQHLNRCGFNVEFFNVAAQMLRYPEFDVNKFFENAPAMYFAVDLHWLAHAHGALELARLYKEIHPSAKVIVGGISATYYHEELIGYPQIDYVIRGYDTLLPVELLMKTQNSSEALSQVPNLTWKHNMDIHINEMSHLPDCYSAVVDWRQTFKGNSKSMTPYNLLIPQAGCEYNCRWCGGSRYFFAKYMALNKTAKKIPEMLQDELKSIVKARAGTHTVTTINFWHEYPEVFDSVSDVFTDEVDRIHYSLNRLPNIDKGRRMAKLAKAVFELSPDSHDPEIGKASGRGKFTMKEMEGFIDALIDEVYSFEIYFMIGLPKQTVTSIWENVDYCEHLLKKYQGKKVIPFICPMLPFLDPGSQIYDNAEKWGYRIFHRTLEDHRKSLLSMNWKHRINYETKWLSRDELVNISYESVRALTLLKSKYGLLPAGISKGIINLIDTTRKLLEKINAYQEMSEGESKEMEGRGLRERVSEYNKKQFKMVRSQQRPVDLGFSRRQWFDTDEAFEKIMQCEDGSL